MQPIKVTLEQNAYGRWNALLWGKSSQILRPVPGNTRPASAAEWLTPFAAERELPELLGHPIEIVHTTYTPKR